MFAFLGLSIFSFPHKFEISFVIWCIVSTLTLEKNASDWCLRRFPCFNRCSLGRSWFSWAERSTSSLCHSCWTFLETTRSHPKWCSSCGLVVSRYNKQFEQGITRIALCWCQSCGHGPNKEWLSLSSKERANSWGGVHRLKLKPQLCDRFFVFSRFEFWVRLSVKCHSRLAVTDPIYRSRKQINRLWKHTTHTLS